MFCTLFSLSVSTLWVILALLISVSGLAAAAEAALFSLGEERLAQLEEKGEKSTTLIRELLQSPQELLVTLTLLSDALNILAVILITWLSSMAGSSEGPGFFRLYFSRYPQLSALLFSLFLLVLFAHTLPKAVGVRASGVLAPRLAPPLAAVMRVVKPVWTAVSWVAELIFGVFGIRTGKAEERLAGEDIRELVEASSRHGLLDVTERELLVNLLRSGDIRTNAVMTPRHEIVAVPVETTEEEVRAVMKEKGFSRLPVYEGSREHYVGVVTAKDLLKLRQAHEEGKGLKEVMRPLLLVPESRRITDLLLDFKRGRIHLALVVDEFGAVSGLVTLEDVLEEIFGEVQEEEEEPELSKVGENRWKALGSMVLTDFNALIGASLPSAGAATLAGLVLARLGRRPRPGDEVHFAGFGFRVLEVHGIIIHRLEIWREEGRE